MLVGQDTWCVLDETDPMLVQHFESREEAVAYARHCAAIDEGDVYIHETSCPVGIHGWKNLLKLPMDHLINKSSRPRAR